MRDEIRRLPASARRLSKETKTSAVFDAELQILFHAKHIEKQQCRGSSFIDISSEHRVIGMTD